jgi:hypothetical protein
VPPPPTAALIFAATAALNPSFVSKGSYMVLDVTARDGSGAKAVLSPRVVKLEN